MEHTSTTQEMPSEVSYQLAHLKENYGENNTAELIALFSAEHPELTPDEVVKVIYDVDMRDMPRSTSWPDTTLDRKLIFR